MSGLGTSELQRGRIATVRSLTLRGQQFLPFEKFLSLLLQWAPQHDEGS